MQWRKHNREWDMVFEEEGKLTQLGGKRSSKESPHCFGTCPGTNSDTSSAAAPVTQQDPQHERTSNAMSPFSVRAGQTGSNVRQVTKTEWHRQVRRSDAWTKKKIFTNKHNTVHGTSASCFFLECPTSANLWRISCCRVLLSTAWRKCLLVIDTAPIHASREPRTHLH